ncbi:MAG TPA: S8 family serine peptidase [Thermoanaerobaculia bacterium]|nr:S8 family serine peptidase [Thermoanaerobaculia bacterium]
MTRRLILTFALLASLPLFAEETQRYLVATRTRPSRSRIRVLADSDAHRVRTFRNVNAFGADLTAAEVAELRRSSDVEFVTPVVMREALEVEPLATTRDSELASSWGVNAVHAPDVWPVTRGESINVAVLDTGIELEHPDLRDAYAGGVNFVDPTKPPQDDNKHGTHVSGIIAARRNNFGVVGVAPGVKIWAVKVLDAQGTGTDEAVAAGVDWVIEHAKAGGLWVINLSLGANSPSEVEERAIEQALTDNVVVVASAGNRTPWVRYPAKYPGVIAVGAVDDLNQRADFSSVGAGLSIMAPGVAVLSTFPQGRVKTADVRPDQDDSVFPGWGLIGSPLAIVHGILMNAGYGRPEDIPEDMPGHIALIQRGLIPFREKARNAKEAGATAVVIWNNLPDEGEVTWTMKTPADDPVYGNYEFPLTVGVQQDDGLALTQVRGVVEVGFRDDPYGKLNGTSMASPHVAGIVALLRALAPQTPVAQFKYVLERTAHDMEKPGWDPNTGWGAVDALAAAKYVAPEKFNAPPTTPPQSPRRRAVH